MILSVSVVYYFLFSNNISLYVPSLPLVDTCPASIICHYEESYYAIFIKKFLETFFFTSLEKFPRVKLLSPGVGLCLIL